MSDAPRDDENMQDLLVSDGEHEEQRMDAPPERDEIDDLIDSDPEVRSAVKQEIKNRLLNQQQAVRQEQAPPPPAEPSELERVQAELEETDSKLDAFFETPEANRNYEEYEKMKLRQSRLMRRESQLKDEARLTEQAVSRAPQIVDAWIREQAAVDRNITRYATRIRELARTLRPNIQSDEASLRDALKYMVEPTAYKEYHSRNARRQQTRRDTPSGEAYMDDDGGQARKPKDKYADASPEEREFLRNVGLVKDQQKSRDNELIPTPDGQGYFIPIPRRSEK